MNILASQSHFTIDLKFSYLGREDHRKRERKSEGIKFVCFIKSFQLILCTKRRQRERERERDRERERERERDEREWEASKRLSVHFPSQNAIS